MPTSNWTYLNLPHEWKHRRNSLNLELGIHLCLRPRAQKASPSGLKWLRVSSADGPGHPPRSSLWPKKHTKFVKQFLSWPTKRRLSSRSSGKKLRQTVFLFRSAPANQWCQLPRWKSSGAHQTARGLAVRQNAWEREIRSRSNNFRIITCLVPPLKLKSLLVNQGFTRKLCCEYFNCV